MLILAMLHFHFVRGTLPEDKLKDTTDRLAKQLGPYNSLCPSP